MIPKLWFSILFYRPHAIACYVINRLLVYCAISRLAVLPSCPWVSHRWIKMVPVYYRIGGITQPVSSEKVSAPVFIHRFSCHTGEVSATIPFALRYQEILAQNGRQLMLTYNPMISSIDDTWSAIRTMENSRWSSRWGMRPGSTSGHIPEAIPSP